MRTIIVEFGQNFGRFINIRIIEVLAVINATWPRRPQRTTIDDPIKSRLDACKSTCKEVVRNGLLTSIQYTILHEERAS